MTDMEIIVPKSVSKTGIAIAQYGRTLFPVCPTCERSGMMYQDSSSCVMICGNVVSGGCKTVHRAGVGTIEPTRLRHTGDLSQIMWITRSEDESYWSVLSSPEGRAKVLRWISDWTGLDETLLDIS